MKLNLHLTKATTLKAGFLFGLLLLMPLAGCLGADGNEDSDKETLVIAYEVRDDYATVDENPQALADYLSAVLGMRVELYNSQSEGAMLEALRFGNADIAIMDGGAAWVGWQRYGLDVMAADQKLGRPYPLHRPCMGAERQRHGRSRSGRRSRDRSVRAARRDHVVPHRLAEIGWHAVPNGVPHRSRPCRSGRR